MRGKRSEIESSEFGVIWDSTLPFCGLYFPFGWGKVCAAWLSKRLSSRRLPREILRLGVDTSKSWGEEGPGLLEGVSTLASRCLTTTARPTRQGGGGASFVEASFVVCAQLRLAGLGFRLPFSVFCLSPSPISYITFFFFNRENPRLSRPCA